MKKRNINTLDDFVKIRSTSLTSDTHANNTDQEIQNFNTNLNTITNDVLDIVVSNNKNTEIVKCYQIENNSNPTGSLDFSNFTSCISYHQVNHLKQPNNNDFCANPSKCVPNPSNCVMKSANSILDNSLSNQNSSLNILATTPKIVVPHKTPDKKIESIDHIELGDIKLSPYETSYNLPSSFSTYSQEDPTPIPIPRRSNSSVIHDFCINSSIKAKHYLDHPVILDSNHCTPSYLATNSHTTTTNDDCENGILQSSINRYDNNSHKKIVCSASSNISNFEYCEASILPLENEKHQPNLADSLKADPFSMVSSKLSHNLYDPASIDPMLYLSKYENTQSFSFLFMSKILDLIENEKGMGVGSKKRTILILSNFLRTLLWHCSSDVLPFMYLCLNKVRSNSNTKDLGIGEAFLIKLITDVYGRSESCIRKDLEKLEDLGRVAETSRCKMRVLYQPERLTIKSVFTELKDLYMIAGNDSQLKKRDKVKKLLVCAEGNESKYIIRFLLNKIRLRIQSNTLYQALGTAFSLTTPPINPYGQSSSSSASDHRKNPSKNREITLMEETIKTCLTEMSDVDFIIKLLFTGCSYEILKQKCFMIPGIPIVPMLAKPLKGIQEVVKKINLDEFTYEFKYDGERIQIHILSDASIMLFSRSLDPLNGKYPDVINMMIEARNEMTSTCILDSEIVAWDKENNIILPFQLLATRKKKNTSQENISIDVCLFLFDCVFYNGKCLTDLSLMKRREYLYKAISEIPNQVMFVRSTELTTIDDLDSFLLEAIDSNCEGLMIKRYQNNGTYEPSKRTSNWLKLKKDYMENLGDTFDLVPIGAYLGKGKRSKVFGAFLLACYNDENDIFQTVCKVGTGFSDKELKNIYTNLKNCIIETPLKNYDVNDRMIPDIWFEPKVVWEIKAADLSLSPVHTAASKIMHSLRGISLRFPRYIRERHDKKPVNATTSSQIVNVFENQNSTIF